MRGLSGKRGKALVAARRRLTQRAVPVARGPQRRPRCGSRRARGRTPRLRAPRGAGARPRLRVPGIPLAADRRRARTRAPVRSTGCCSVASRATTCCPCGSASSCVRAGSVATRRCPAAARSAASFWTGSATSSLSAVFFAIGLQAVASAEWLVRLAVGAMLAVAVIAVALVLARLYSSRRGHRVGASRRAVVS